MGKKSGVTPKRARFVEEYLKDLNGTQAVIRAGYSPNCARTMADKLLNMPEVRAMVEQAIRERASNAKVSALDVVREIARIAFSDGRKLLDESGRLRPPSEWDDDTARAIASIEVVELFEGSGENREKIGELKKVKLWDKPKNLEMLMRHLGLLDGKPKEPPKPFEIRILSPEDSRPPEKKPDDSEA